MKEIVLHKLKVFAWGVVGAILMAGVTFLGSNLDLVQQFLEEALKLNPALVVLIIGIVSDLVRQLTKAINQKFNLEEQIGRAVNKLRGRA